MSKRRREFLKKYSVYDKRTDQPVIIGGTAEECAAAMGVATWTFYVEYSKLKNGKLKSNKWEIFLDDDDEEVAADE